MTISEHIRQFFTLEGKRIDEVYRKNRMGVHNQGHYLSVSSPLALAKEGTLTLAVVISPDGVINGMIDAGALVFLNDHPLQLGSVPFVRVGKQKCRMLTSFTMSAMKSSDDFPLPENYYYEGIARGNVSVSIATPLAELQYRLGKCTIARRILSPLLSANDRFLPVAVEEYAVTNNSRRAEEVTIVVPLPSLVHSSKKVSRPREQDYTFLGAAAVAGQQHTRFTREGVCGVIMGNTASDDRMAIALPEIEGVSVSVQEAFRLRNYNQDLTLNESGAFHHENPVEPGNDYGGAVRFTVKVPAGETVTVPVAKVYDFPLQKYPDGVEIPRRYTAEFSDNSSRTAALAVRALSGYTEWCDRTVTIQNRMLATLKESSAYRNDHTGALVASRLLFNELSYLYSNASVLDIHGQARFLECFDYPFNNSADVDFYSKLLLAVFPDMERDLCQKFIDSINTSDEELRFYHSYISDPIAQQEYLQTLEKERRAPGSDIHVYAAKKADGSVFHDLGSLTFGNPLRNVSEYTWFNTSYWIDLFPKLALRVLRDAKYTGDTSFVVDNWATLKKGFGYLMTLDYDGDGIPEGRPGEVRNTYDNIPFAGVDVYDVNLFVACLRAMMRMAEITGDEALKSRCEGMLVTAEQGYDRLWYTATAADGTAMSYYLTCTGDADGVGRCTDVFTDQLVGLWQWIAMGEKSFLPHDRVVSLLSAIYRNNRTPMGWAVARKQDGSPVDSDQGKDVWIASNYVLAQMLMYYGMSDESKEVYSCMDRIIFEHGNSLNTAESVRPEYEKQPGEKNTCPHYIVASYPRPGAIYDILFLNAIREEWKKTPDVDYIESDRLKTIIQRIFCND